MGLTPPPPSSVDPSGIPTRPPDADTDPVPVGEEADAAGFAKELALLVGQVPDAALALLPPSNTVELDVAALDAPVPKDPVPKDVPDVPMLELATPKEACGMTPPLMPPHVALKLGVGPSDAPEVRGLTPNCPGTTVATGGAASMPSGDVMPSGDGPGDVPPICAEAEALPMRTMAIVAANRRIIAGRSLACGRKPAKSRSHPSSRHLPPVAATWPLLRPSAPGPRCPASSLRWST
jgi:hypothetical protein